MSEFNLRAISPIDGRYADKVKELSDYFSEFALIKYRIYVEIEYFISLCEIELLAFDNNSFNKLRRIHKNFSIDDAQRVKEIERKINHDIKAVEYFLKEKFDEYGWSEFKEFIHFGLTSQDINNTAVPLLLKDALNKVYLPSLKEIINLLKDLTKKWKNTVMLARTHGQPASPTTVGKEIMVFVERLEKQINLLSQIPIQGKFGGATGNFNAHYVAYPDVDWLDFADKLLTQLGIERQKYTTQIQHYDNLSAIFDNLKRINVILIDLCRDFWTYISMEYFNQKIKENEVGSSTMPHKINPIDFENAEGNLGIANSIYNHLSEKLPISRLQRDLTDSTVVRNIGVPIAHSLIALKSLDKGINKLQLNKEKIDTDLENNWAVIAEAIQTILRKISYPEPYEALKELTRNNKKIEKKDIQNFIDNLNISDEMKKDMKSITPYNYIGKTKPIT